jgi:hypothetical protein
MGTLHQNRKAVPVKTKEAKLKGGENVSVYQHKLMIMKREGGKLCLIRLEAKTGNLLPYLLDQKKATQSYKYHP